MQNAQFQRCTSLRFNDTLENVRKNASMWANAQRNIFRTENFAARRTAKVYVRLYEANYVRRRIEDVRNMHLVRQYGRESWPVCECLRSERLRQCFLALEFLMKYSQVFGCLVDGLGASDTLFRIQIHSQSSALSSALDNGSVRARELNACSRTGAWTITKSTKWRAQLGYGSAVVSHSIEDERRYRQV